MSEDEQHFDAIVVGAGFAGMYALHRLRDELGLSVRVYEAGDGVGGTWYWNRYPGARCDSDSYIYCYTFDDALLQEWEWSERYPEQPEILRYLNHVADRFDLRSDITFGTRVTGAAYDESAKRWTVRTETGASATADFVIGAVGCLSSSNLPQIAGLDDFGGKTYHTGRWPHAGVDFTAKRVGVVVGTGASAVQAIPVIAQQAKSLTVFQRTPNYCVPARNGKVDPDVAKARKANYAQIKENIKNSYFGFELNFILKSALEESSEERERIFNEMWDAGGFPFWLGNYQDMFFSKEANEVCAEFLRRKIRETVKDPVVAEKLIPTSYPYGTKRQPLDTNYFETFNKSNVTLVDVNETPIERITATGVKTTRQEYPLDILVFATGFDAMTGPLTKMDVRGRGGVSLAERWAEGPQSYLGLMVADFPNLFTVTGPGSPSVLSNMPVSIEQHVDWICGQHRASWRRTISRRLRRAPRPNQEQWTAHVAAGREHIADARGELMVHGSQHRRQGSGVHAVPRRRRTVPRKMPRSCGKWLRGFSARRQSSASIA